MQVSLLQNPGDEISRSSDNDGSSVNGSLLMNFHLKDMTNLLALLLPVNHDGDEVADAEELAWVREYKYSTKVRAVTCFDDGRVQALGRLETV